MTQSKHFGISSNAGILTFLVLTGVAQTNLPACKSDNQVSGSQINVNWLYGSYVPKNVPLQSLNNGQRFKLYIRQTCTTPGIYIKTPIFAVRDQISNSQPEWGV